ncbi:hypothetical protein [Yersinia ruckeri]|uniref:hypothetical protein n=1 Tax=Yersinia ruckeri TaxID=29486 RepID=UPI002237B74C|nr:hypothetical protein [Yersinia ruckeri]MCW6598773.1 hypothetical protein [Yersinia ruckeri]
MKIQYPSGLNPKLRPLWYQIQTIRVSLLNKTIQDALGSQRPRIESLFARFQSNFLTSYGLSSNWKPSRSDPDDFSDFDQFKSRVIQLNKTLGSRKLSFSLIDLLRSFINSGNYSQATQDLREITRLVSAIKSQSTIVDWKALASENNSTVLANNVQTALYSEDIDDVMFNLMDCNQRYSDPVINTLIAYLTTKSKMSFSQIYLYSYSWKLFWQYAPTKTRILALKTMPKSHLIQTAGFLGLLPKDVLEAGIRLSDQAIKLAAVSSDENIRSFWVLNVNSIPVTPVIEYRGSQFSNVSSMSKLEQDIYYNRKREIRNYVLKLKLEARKLAKESFDHPIIKIFRKELATNCPAQVKDVPLAAFQSEDNLIYVYQILDGRLSSKRTSYDIIGYMVYDLKEDAPIWWQSKVLTDAALNILSPISQTVKVITSLIKTGRKTYERT